MKIVLFLGLFFPIIVSSQHELIKDLDGDKVNDTIYINYDTSKIICLLSTSNFKRMTSKEIEMLNESSHITGTKNGFEFSLPWMRAGYHNQFRYDKKNKENAINRYE